MKSDIFIYYLFCIHLSTVWYRL